MGSQIHVLLPYVLETLNRKPEMCETYENLRNEIKKAFAIKNMGDLDDALIVGQNLGVLTLSDDLVSVPFNYTSRRLRATGENALTDEEYGVQPRRTYSIPSYLFSQARRRGSRRRRRSRRSRSRICRSRSRH